MAIGAGGGEVQSGCASVNIKGPYFITRFHVDETFQNASLCEITKWERPLCREEQTTGLQRPVGITKSVCQISE